MSVVAEARWAKGAEWLKAQGAKDTTHDREQFLGRAVEMLLAQKLFRGVRVALVNRG